MRQCSEQKPTCFFPTSVGSSGSRQPAHSPTLHSCSTGTGHAFFHATEPSTSAVSSQHDCVRPQHQYNNFVSIPLRDARSDGRRVTVALRCIVRDGEDEDGREQASRTAEARSRNSFKIVLSLEEGRMGLHRDQFGGHIRAEHTGSSTTGRQRP